MKMSSLNLPGPTSAKQIGAFSITAAAQQKPKLNMMAGRQKKQTSEGTTKRPQSSFTRLSIQNQGAILKSANPLASNSIANQYKTNEGKQNLSQGSHTDQSNLNLLKLQTQNSGNKINDQIRLYSAKKEQRDTDCYQLANSTAQKKQKNNMDLQIELDPGKKGTSAKPAHPPGSPSFKLRGEMLDAGKKASNINMGAEIEQSRFNSNQNQINKSNFSKLGMSQHQQTSQANFDWVGQILLQEGSNSKLSKDSRPMPLSAADRGGHDVYSNILVRRDPMQLASQLANDKQFKQLNNYIGDSRASKNNSKLLSQRNISSFDKITNKHVLSLDSAKHSRDSRKRVVFIKNKDRISESHLNSTKHKNVATNFEEFPRSNPDGKTPVCNSLISMNNHQWRQTRSPTKVTLLEKTKVKTNNKSGVNGRSLKGYSEKFEIEMITTLPSQKGIVYNDAYKTQFRKAFKPQSVNRSQRDDQWRPKQHQHNIQLVASGSQRSVSDSQKQNNPTQVQNQKQRYQPQTTKSQTSKQAYLNSRNSKSGRSVVKINQSGNRSNMQAAQVADGPSINVRHYVSTNQHESTTKASGKDLFELFGQSQQKASNVQLLNYEHLYGNSTTIKKQRPVSAYVNSKSVSKIRPQQIRSGHPAVRNSRQILQSSLNQTPNAMGYCSTVGNALTMLEETQSRSMNSTHALKKRQQIIKETQCKLTKFSKQLTNLKIEDATGPRGQDTFTANIHASQSQKQIEKMIMTPPENWGAFTNPNLNYNPLGDVASKNQIEGNHDLGLGVNFKIVEHMLSPQANDQKVPQITTGNNKKDIHVLIEKKKRQLQARISRDLGDGSQKLSNQFMIAKTSSATRPKKSYEDLSREPTPLQQNQSKLHEQFGTECQDIAEIQREARQSQEQESLNLQSSPSVRGDQTNQSNLKPKIFVKPIDEQECQSQQQLGGLDQSDYAEISEKIQGWNQMNTGQSPSPLKKLRSDQKRNSPIFKPTTKKTKVKSPKRQASCDIAVSKINQDKSRIINGTSTPEKKNISPNTTMSKIGGQSPLKLVNRSNKLVIEIEGNPNKSETSPELKESHSKNTGNLERINSKESKKITKQIVEMENEAVEQFMLKPTENNEFLESILREQEHSANQQKRILRSIKHEIEAPGSNQDANQLQIQKSRKNNDQIQKVKQGTDKEKEQFDEENNLNRIKSENKKQSAKQKKESCSFDEDLINQNINLADYPYDSNNLLPQPNLIDVVKVVQGHQQIININQSLATFEPDSFIADKNSHLNKANAQKKQQLLQTDLTPQSLKSLKKHEVTYIQNNCKLNNLLQSNKSSQKSLEGLKKRRSNNNNAQLTNQVKATAHPDNKRSVTCGRSSQSVKNLQKNKRIKGLMEMHKFTDVAKTDLEHDFKKKNSQDTQVKQWFDSLMQFFTEIRSILGSNKTFNQRKSQISQECQLNQALEELELAVVEYLTQNRLEFSEVQHNMCSDIFSQLIVLKNNVRSYKDVAELMFMRRVEQIQKLVSSRQALLTQILNFIQMMLQQISHHNSIDTPIRQMDKLVSQEQETQTDLIPQTWKLMNMTNIQINTFGQYTPSSTLNLKGTSMNRMAYSTKSSFFLKNRLVGSTTQTAAENSASSTRKFMPAQAALHSRTNSNKFFKKLRKTKDSLGRN